MRKRINITPKGLLVSILFGVYAISPLQAGNHTVQDPRLETGVNKNCKMTTVFPDKTKFTDNCFMTILPAGQSPVAPKGMIQFTDSNKKVNIFSLNFFPPKEIKPNVTYSLTTDTVESFLNGLVQVLPPDGLEQCRMTKKFPTSGTVIFTAVGATSDGFHGTLQVFPACYMYMGTPQRVLVPGGAAGGGTTTVEF